MPEQPSLTHGSSRLLPGGQTVSPLTSYRAEQLMSSDHKPDRPGSSTQTNAAQKGTGSDTQRAGSSPSLHPADRVIHPSWLALIEFCRELGYGELERLSIQDGLPVVAETVRKKCKFTR